MWQRMPPEAFANANALRWVHAWGAGAEGFLFPEFVKSDVVLTTGKGTAGVHVAEQAMALLLALTRGVGAAQNNRSWTQRKPIRAVVWELLDRTLGIVGLGGNGIALAQRAHGFGMRIIAVDPEPVAKPDYVEACWRMDRLPDLLRQADVVAICAPLTPATRGMFNRDLFGQMQPHALLINTARGKIVDEEALMEALTKKIIGGAGLDTLPREPLPNDHPLWRMPNVVITPHVGGGSPRRQDRIVGRFCENLRRFLAGEPLVGVIDKHKGY
jgi:phosphoglycerate dehydrogenase-like enzyme